MAKKASKKKTGSEIALSDFNKAMRTSLLKEAKTLGASPLMLQAPKGTNGALSTGLLCVDLITGGGFPKKRMSLVSGDSGAGKSTLLQKSMGLMLELPDRPMVNYIDFEGAADHAWMLRNGTDFNKYLDKFFYYFPDFTTGDDAMRFIHRTQENAIAYFLKHKMELDYHANVYFYDSIPAGVGEALEENDEAGSQPHLALMLSKMLPLIKPKLRKSASAFIGVNQLRVNPRAQFGNPEYEPGGNAPTFYADMKLWMKAVSKPKDIDLEDPHAIVPTDTKFFKAGGINIEVNPDGSEDRYKYTHFKTQKNRVFSPLKETYMRIWVEDNNGMAQGIDLVWDTLRFYEEIGLCQFNDKSEVFLDGHKYDYFDLKAEILTKPDLRQRGFDLLQSGNAFDMYFTRIGGQPAQSADEDVNDQVDEQHDPEA